MNQGESNRGGPRRVPPPIPVPPRIPEPPPIPPHAREQPRSTPLAVGNTANWRSAIPGKPALRSAVALNKKRLLARRVAAPPPVSSLLAPEELERYKDLLVFARATVEGYFVGKHRSPNRGSSVEFADYKEYVPGDEVNRIDWRAYGRARRLFVRQYEAETDMVVYLLVDTSASMRYGGPTRLTKFIVAAKIAAALAYLVIRQGDKAALGLFHHKLSRFLPAGGTRRHLYNMVAELERIEPASTTGIAHALTECNPLFKKRGRLVILSDFWTDHGEFLDALGPFLHRKFDFLLLHVLDPDELDLPATATAKFKDMESNEEVQVELEEIRAEYRQTVRQRIDALAQEANSRKVNHALVNTRDPYLRAIEAYLGFRGINTLAKH